MVKADIFSGFLGAGKTTLIRKFVEEAYRGESLVIVENEFGEVGIDKGFLDDTGIEITEMNSGCICCTLVGDFTQALSKVVKEMKPDRIVIEPSGVAKLSDVREAVEKVEGIEINGIATVVDAKKCKMYMKNFGEFFGNQIENANLIVLSHTENLDESKISDVVNLIREHNHEGEILVTEWDKIEGKEILNMMEKHVHCHSHGDCCCHDHCEEDHLHHHADDVFASCGMESVHKFGMEELIGILENIEALGNILRAKGIVEGKDINDWLYFDYVPGEKEIRTGRAQNIGKISIIGTDLDEEKLREVFAAC